MSSSKKHPIYGNAEGKTGWQHFKEWISDSKTSSVPHPLKGRFNPLSLDLGDRIDLKDPLNPTQSTSYEIQSILCFQAIDQSSQAIQYELQGTHPRLVLEALEDQEAGVLYTLYEETDAFELDPHLMQYCMQNDEIEHTLTQVGSEGEETTLYLKDTEVESRVLVYIKAPSRENPTGDARFAQVSGFYYTSASESNEKKPERYLVIEAWKEDRWMRFYCGHAIIQSWITSLGTYVEE